MSLPARTTTISDAPKIISGLIETYDDLVAAFRARREQLGMTNFDLEMVSGLHGGYVAKLENWRDVGYGRAAGPQLLPLWLGGLGVGLQLVELPEGHRYYRPTPKADNQNAA